MSAASASSQTVSAELRGVRFRYGNGSDFELTVPRLALPSGAVVACVGSSGSGKSTLLDLLAGRLVPSAGEVRVAGTAVSSLSLSQRRVFRLTHVGMVAQTLALVEHLTAIENILLVATIAGVSPKPVERAHELAIRLGVNHLLRRRPARLSQGERQRIAICRALLLDPGVLLCDEPTGNLDPARSRSITEMLVDTAKSHGTAVIMTTHDHSLLDMVDHVVRVSETGGVAADDGELL